MSIAAKHSHFQGLKLPIAANLPFLAQRASECVIISLCHLQLGQMRMCERSCASLCVFVGCAEHHKMSIFSPCSLMRLLNSGFRSSQILAF